MGRIGRGWALTQESWAVVRGDRSLRVFPVVSAICALIVAAVFFGVGAGLGAASDSIWPAVPFVVVGVYLLIVIGQFSAVALAACATRALGGEDTTFGEGVAAARSRMGIILGWSAVVLVVGAAITALQALLRGAAGNVVGSIIGGLANFAWTIGGAIFVVGILPGILLVVAGAALTGSTAALGAVVIAIGVVVIVIAALLQTTLNAVFRVALFRFATQGDVAGRFSQDQLARAFRPKGGRSAV